MLHSKGRGRLALCTLVFTVSISTLGCEDMDLQFAGEPENTAVSGTPGTVTTLSVGNGRYGLESVEWAEGGAAGGLDRPCFLRAIFRRLSDAIDGSDDANTVERTMNVCNNGNYNKGSLMGPRLRFTREAYATGELESWHLFANKIQTCDSAQSGNDRIKGVTLWGASPFGVSVPEPSLFECSSDFGGGVISGPCSEEEVWRARAERANCGKWSPLMACPAGKIASALRVHTSGNEIVGLGLTCDSVVTTDPSP